MNLRRAAGPPLVIGHRGAAAHEPENTLPSLAAGVAAGADLVEFDIGPDLRLAHSEHERPVDYVSLDEALAFLSGHDVGVHLDAKEPGYEQALVDAVRRHGLEGRTVVSTAFAQTTRRLEQIAPSLPRAIGYPRDRFGVSGIHWPRGATRAAAAALAQAMPLRLPLLIRRARANVLALHYTLCSQAAVTAAHRAGVPVLAWTVNHEDRVRRLADIGVDAIVSDDPQMARTVLATLKRP